MITIRLTHFQRGAVDVHPVTGVDGEREWVVPGRPMMRPWPYCYFTESPAEIDTLWLAAINTSSANAKEGTADRLSPQLHG